MPSQKVRFAEFQVDFAQRELRKGGVTVKLQHKPFLILEMLLKQPGELVSRQELAHALWPGLHVSFERGLNTAVNVLRQTLGESSQAYRFIETRSGLGYRFVAPVEPVTEPPKSRPSLNTEEDCLKGHYFLDKMTEEALSKAIAYFEAALVPNPHCAPAYAGLADAYCQSALFTSVHIDSSARRAKEYSVAAIHYDAGLAEGHVALARVKMLFDWDWASARAEFQRAIELDPDCAGAHRAYAAFLSACASHAEALYESELALALDPLSCPISAEHAWHLYLAGDFRGALEQCWKVLTLEPAFSPAQHTLGLAYQQLDMSEEAIVELQNADRILGDHPAAVSALGHVYATAGMAAEAMEVVRELDQRSQRRPVSPYWYGLIHSRLGERTLALDALENASRRRDPALLWMHVDPRLNSLRSEARFRSLHPSQPAS